MLIRKVYMNAHSNSCLDLLCADKLAAVINLRLWYLGISNSVWLVCMKETEFVAQEIN